MGRKLAFLPIFSFCSVSALPTGIPLLAWFAMSMNADKALIKRRFTHALATYEQAATVQGMVADRLLSLLGQTLPRFRPERVLEIGCATGLLTERIVARYPGLFELVANDLVDDCGICLAGKGQDWPLNLQFLPGDIESIALPGRFDGIISSSTLQWVTDFPALAQKLARHLVPGGTLAIALYGPDNFRELRELTNTGLPYLTLTELKSALTQAGLRLLAAGEHREEMRFASPLALLHHLKDTGVNALTDKNGKPGWTRGRLAAFADAYRARFGGPEGVPLTYHPQYLIAVNTAEA